MTSHPARTRRSLRPAPPLGRALRVGWTLCLVGLVIAFWPTALGGATSYVIVSGQSMLPALHEGDLVFLRSQDEYAVGDVVAFHPPPGDIAHDAVVIHRLVAGDVQDGFIAQGDNNDHLDPWDVQPSQVLGEQWLTVPKVGLLLAWVRSPLGLGLLAAGLGVYLTLAWERRREEDPAEDESVSDH